MTQRVLDASSGRDRVIDAVKALALTLVILGHALAWTTLPDGKITNTLEVAPSLYPLTWILQVLPLFFLLAGAGMVKRSADSHMVFKRVDRLVTPTLPLLAGTLVISIVIARLVGGEVGKAAGLLPIQLTWFIGVYLIVVAISPLLRRMTTVWHFAAGLAAIGLVDAARVNIAPGLGWVNLVLAWSYFAALGMYLSTLRTLPKWIPAVGLAGSLAGAVTAVTLGPYSKALITTEALPGLSNLAPPTIVLVLAGLAQVCLLLLVWPLLARLLSHDRVWVPVAVFSTRAMGIYLYHMLVLSALVAVLLLAGFAPPPLGLAWWVAHVVVLFVVVATVWFSAPLLLKLANLLAASLSRLLPRGLSRHLGRVPAWAASVCAALAGVNYLLMSESGISQPLEMRSVIYLPYVPVVALALIALIGILSHASALDRKGSGQ